MNTEGKLSADAALSPDGRFIAISNVVSGFYTYHASTVQLEHVLKTSGPPQNNTDRPVPVRFIENGNAIFGGSCSGRIRIWDAKTGNILQKINHEGIYSSNVSAT